MTHIRQQETPEEAAERIYPENWQSIMDGQHDSNSYERTAFINGAKWQAERMYSEEEVIALLESLVEHPTKPGYKRKDILKVIEQLKKKS